MSKRIMLTIAYDGTDYVGWQMQPNGIAVEQVVNKALSELLKENITVIGASRTDSGVHALGNVAVFDTDTRIPAEKICFALNQRLPNDIVCTSSREVDENFHPRKASCIKTYEYSIYNSAHPDPLKRRFTYFVYVPLDVDAMRKAAGYLVGEHDFASFCSSHSQAKSTIRRIYSIDIIAGEVPAESRSASGYSSHDIVIRISGNGFLYNMVRIIAGTLVKIGYHFYPPVHMKEILEARDRSKAGPKAPAEGLKLIGIEYDQS